MPLRDEISPVHEERIKHFKVSRFLDMEVPPKNDKIVEGKWQLTEEEKMQAINNYYGLKFNESKALMAKFKPSEQFLNTLRLAFINAEEYQLNIQNPSLLDLTYLYGKNNFKTIGGETKEATKVLKDEEGKPVLGEDGKITRVEKPIGELVWTNNKGNINDFINTYNIAYPEENIYNPFAHAPFSSIPSMTGTFNIDLFAKNHMYLYISGRPMDIMNQSMTGFFNSCQTIYREDFRPILANAMDKNTKIAYLMFDVPWVDVKKKEYPFTAFSRMFVRVAGGQIFFDNVYPDRVRTFLHKIIENRTGMKNEYKGNTYHYTTPDGYAIHSYMDILKPQWKREVSLEELLKDLRLKNLAEHFKIDPMSIDKIEDKVYETEKGKYIIYTDEEVYNDTVESIKTMVYKQDVYSKYLKIDDFFASKDKDAVTFLKGYESDKNFESLVLWSEKNKIKKHDLYRQLKAYLVPEFCNKRLNEDKVKLKIKALSTEEPLEIGDNFKAYKPAIEEKKTAQPQYKQAYVEPVKEVKKKIKPLLIDAKVFRIQILNDKGVVIAALKKK